MKVVEIDPIIGCYPHSAIKIIQQLSYALYFWMKCCMNLIVKTRIACS